MLKLWTVKKFVKLIFLSAIGHIGVALHVLKEYAIRFIPRDYQTAPAVYKTSSQNVASKKCKQASQKDN